jgi:beta-glucosidase
MIDRRTLIGAGIATGAAMMAAPGLAARKAAANPAFPKGFLWGVATAPHQIEGNNIGSDLWFLENQQPTVFAEPSGDACNNLDLWESDLELIKGMGLNCYRFGIEWSRIEPEKGRFSQAMLDHYKAIIEGCHARGLAPVVTFSHFTAPRWFSAQGGWTNPESAQLFARYCDKAMRALGQGIARVITFNEPNILLLLKPSFQAVSVMNFSTEPMVTAPWPENSMTQLPSHRRSCGQMRPQISGMVEVMLLSS